MEAKNEGSRKSVARKAPERYDLKTKCAAVLAVWSERRKPAEVCRELGIRAAMFSGWQNRAMEGMLQGLSPKSTERPPPLNPLLEQRLARTMASRTTDSRRLQQRLRAVDSTVPPPGLAKG